MEDGADVLEVGVTAAFSTYYNMLNKLDNTILNMYNRLGFVEISALGGQHGQDYWH
jgi:hypothetical protein